MNTPDKNAQFATEEEENRGVGGPLPRSLPSVQTLTPHHMPHHMNGWQVNSTLNGAAPSTRPLVKHTTSPDVPTAANKNSENGFEPRYATIIGNSDSMQALTKKAITVARTDTSILLVGESGTGKELIARHIHAWSGRNNGPFIPINCAALPEERLEDELFGHEKGAFTDAKMMKPGLVETAHEGTLFLDEIGEMQPHLQTRILRLLENQCFYRVGGTQVIQTNIRIIGATNRDLARAIPDGRFRKDLFYRFRLMLSLPPLRTRPEDIPSLADFFLHNVCLEWSRPILKFSPQAVDMLQKRPWHGNVRELQSAVEQCVLFKTGTADITSDEIPLHSITAHDPSEDARETDHQGPYHAVVKAFRRKIICDALDRADGNTTRAATLLHLQRTYLGRLIKQLGIRPAAIGEGLCDTTPQI